MKSILRLLATVGAALGLSLGATQANAVPVDLELVLAVDVSTSVNAAEFTLQKQGYVDAFNSASIATAISQGTIGSIAATLVYWANGQLQAVGWTLIDGNPGTEASDFAAAINLTTRPGGIGNFTGLGDAIDYSDTLFLANGYEGTRTVIDVSGDGESNTGRDADDARDDALDPTDGNTDVINGLPIGDQSLLTYYEDNVIGGPGSFAILATSFASFGDAIDDKLLRELNGVPEPGTLLMLAIGLLLVGGVTTRKGRASAAA